MVRVIQTMILTAAVQTAQPICMYHPEMYYMKIHRMQYCLIASCTSSVWENNKDITLVMRPVHPITDPWQLSLWLASYLSDWFTINHLFFTQNGPFSVLAQLGSGRATPLGHV